MGRPAARGVARIAAIALWALAASSVALGCGSKRRDANDDEPVPTPEPALIAPEPLPLGLPTLAGYAYSRGPGRDALRRAVAATKQADWATAEAACREALKIEPGHLEASWQLALNLARQDRYDEVVAPLSAAVAGDYMRWGERSLRARALAGFHRSRYGALWPPLLDHYRAAFRAAIGRGLLVVGRRGRPWYPRAAGAQPINHRSEIYAYDVDTERYMRVSRTNGSLVGFVRAARGELIYTSYRKAVRPEGGRAYISELRIGTIDRERAAMSRREVVLADVVTADIFEDGDALLARIVQAGADGEPRPRPVTLALDIERGVSIPVEDSAATGRVLRVEYDLVRHLRIPVDGVEADWDVYGAAGAFRLPATRKTVELPAGQSASSHSMAWSPTRARLALTTVAAEPCSDEPDERAVILYVVDATTGKRREVARGEGDLAPVWLDDLRLAYIDNTGGVARVALVDVTTGAEVAKLEARGGVSTDRLVSTQACRLPAIDPSEREYPVQELDEPEDDE